MNNRFSITSYVGFYFCFLCYVYLDYISIFFISEGFRSSFNFFKFIESFILVLVLGFLIPITRVTVGSFFSTILFLFVFIPIAVLFSCADSSRYAFYSAFSPALFIMFCTNYLSNKNLNFTVPHIKKSYTMGIYLISSIIALFIAKIIFSGSILNLNFDISKVYDVREEQTGLLYDGVWGYLTNWSVKVFSICAIILSLYRKKYYVFIMLIVLQFVFFGVTTHKSTFFYAIMAVGTYFLSMRYDANIKIVKYSIVAITASFLLAVIFDNVIVGSFALRRAIFVPAYLHYVYFDFFTDNQFVYWSNSALSSFIDYPYHENTARVIGSYLGKPSMAANNGFIASGYMHAGLFGVAFYSFSLFLVLFFLDYFRKNLPVNVIVAFSVAPIISVLTSSDLVTSLLTHGLLIMLLFVYLLSSNPTGKN